MREMDNGRSYAILRSLLVRTAGRAGAEFLEAAVQAFAEEFGARFAFVTRALDFPPTSVRVLAAFRNGAPVGGWDFTLPGTPCEALYAEPRSATFERGLGVGISVIAQDVCRLFEPTRGTGFEAFIGVALWDENNRMIGHVALFFEERFTDLVELKRKVELVQLFSNRVEAELNRIRMDAEREAALAQLAELNGRLAHESVTDMLTRLYNRRHFNERMRYAFVRFQRGGHPFGVLLLDLDNFKSVNDNHGHAVGDDVLITAAGVLSRHTRNGVEEVFRVGGEEFAVICDGIQHETDLAQTAARINEAMRRTLTEAERGPIRVTASIGGALPAPGDRDWAEIYRRADANLYHAKQRGRDRAVIGAPPSAEELSVA